MPRLISVQSEGAKEKFSEWLARGDAIGVFENSDFGSYAFGHTIFMPLTPAEQAEVEVGKTKAPDGPYGLGWRYLLKVVATDLDPFAFDGQCDTCGTLLRESYVARPNGTSASRGLRCPSCDKEAFGEQEE